MPITDQQCTVLQQLDGVIQNMVSHISDFTKNPADFTRARKLNAATTSELLGNLLPSSSQQDICGFICSIRNGHLMSFLSGYFARSDKLPIDATFV